MFGSVVGELGADASVMGDGYKCATASSSWSSIRPRH